MFESTSVWNRLSFSFIVIRLTVTVFPVTNAMSLLRYLTVLNTLNEMERIKHGISIFKNINFSISNCTTKTLLYINYKYRLYN